MKYDKKTFAHNAKAIRLLAGCKQIEFSKIIHLPIKTIGAIEESRSITPEILLKYSEFAGATINDLLLNKIEITTTNKRVTNKKNIKMDTVEVTKEQQLKYLQEFANKHKLVLELNGECGFGRECVGMQHGDLWVSYNPTHSQTCEDIESVYDERHYDIAAPNAYHKFNCLAVLGHDDSAILELYEWCLKLDELECTIETYQTGATGMQAMFSGVTSKALKLNKPKI